MPPEMKTKIEFQNRFGRREAPDARDRAYLMARRLGPIGATLPARKTWRIASKSLEQQGGTCVGHSWANFLRCEPIQSTKGAAELAYAIYDQATLIDEWPGNEGDREFGTSVRAGAEAVLITGRLKSYLWAFSIQPAIEWVLTQGPVVLGTNWYSSMMSTENGLVKITPTANSIGGHAYLWRGCDTRRGLARCENSWGDQWGDNGGFWIGLRDLERLILEGGEVCVAVEQRLKPVNT